jgi:membrane associated rhomboid family serine protease
MFGQSDSDDYQPFGYIGRIPLYLTTILVISYCVAMATLALCQAGNLPDYGKLLDYNSDSVRTHFQFWRFLTYPLDNGVSIWFAIEMYFLYRFGREVERFIGRASFGMLYFSLVVLGPCLLTAISPWSRHILGLAGSWTPDFAVFIAFCTVYPNIDLLFTIQAKWLAAVLFAINSLELLAGHAIVDLLVFWATCLAAFLFIKYLRGHLQFSLRDYLSQRRSRRALRPLPKPRPSILSKPPTPRDNVIESIDPLLDKIAKHGIGSLTPEERTRLEEARAELLKKPAS